VKENAMIELTGVLAAVATPFDTDDRIDELRLRSLTDSLIEAGVHGLVPGGSTGEFAALTGEERRRLLEVVIEQNAGRVPVIAHTGAITTSEAVSLSKHAAGLGAAGLLVLPPYKDRLTVDETSGFFGAIADAVDLPVIVYNLPLATGVNLAPEDIAVIAERSPNVRYVKDTSGDFHQLTRSIHDFSDLYTTLVGWDTMLLAALVEGARGCILGSTNLFAREVVHLYDSVQKSDLATAKRQWARLYPAMRFLLSGGYVGGLKGALDVQGNSVGVPRLPVAELSAERRDEFSEILKAFDASA
jgi:4-hydroxy-tetrahydrodipicolinate synthase